jgi:hypothetical protein
MNEGQWPYLSARAYGLTDTQEAYLKQCQVLSVEYLRDWWCLDCDSYHLFDRQNDQVYKTCLGINYTTGPLANKEDTECLVFDLPKLSEVIAQANHLTQTLSAPTLLNWAMAGFATAFVVWLICEADP